MQLNCPHPKDYIPKNHASTLLPNRFLSCYNFFVDWCEYKEKNEKCFKEQDVKQSVLLYRGEYQQH
jgi:hypothetical protein